MRCVIWDFDGTIAPSFDQIIPSFQVALASVLGRTYARDEITRLFGPPDEAVIAGEVPPTEFPHAMRTFYEEYRRRQAGIKPFPAVDAFIRQTQGRLHHGLVTNKGRLTTRIAIKAAGLAGAFQVVVTGDDVIRPKPHPDGVRRVLEELGLDPSEALYIGDSPTDVEAARQAGVGAIAVAYGGIHDIEALRAMCPDWLAENPEDLRRRLERMGAASRTG